MEGSLWYCTWFGLEATRPSFLKMPVNAILWFCKKPKNPALHDTVQCWCFRVLLAEKVSIKDEPWQNWPWKSFVVAHVGMFNACRIKSSHWSALLRCDFSHMHGSYHLGCSANAMGRCVVAFVWSYLVGLREVSGRYFNYRKFQTRSSPWPSGNSKAPAFGHCLVWISWIWMDEHDHGLPRRSILPSSWTVLVEALCLIGKPKYSAKSDQKYGGLN